MIHFNKTVKAGAGFALMLVVLMSFQAMAADKSIDVQKFRPSIFNGNFLAIEDAHTLNPLCYGFGLYVNYANKLLDLTNRDEDKVSTGVMQHVTSLNLTVAFSPWSWLSLGADVPYHMALVKTLKDIEDVGPFAAEAKDVSTLGDIKAEIKLGILKEKSVGVGLALAGFGTFPTGDPDAFLGEGTTNFGGKLMLEKNLGFINIALNGGYLFRPERDVLNTTIGNAWLFGAGLSHDFKSGFGFSIEYFGDQMHSTSNEQFQSNPMELLGTLRYHFSAGPRLIGGGAAGGGGGAGSPAYRVVGGLDYYPSCEKPPDGKLKVCVQDPEGKPLSAKLGVTGDKTFSVATDVADGCYAASLAAGHYNAKASKEGYLDASKSADIESGKTSEIILVLAPEAKTTLKIQVVAHGTEKPVSGAMIELFKDGKLSAHTADDAGLWDLGEYPPGQVHIKVVPTKAFDSQEADFSVEKGIGNKAVLKVNKKIVPIGKIQFAFDSDVILAKSFPVLENVLEAIKTGMAQEGLKKVRIEGHASAEGTDAYNMDLSSRRAASVKKWLVDHGIDAAMLDPVGFGETKPIAENITEEGREINRRVEFVIIE